MSEEGAERAERTAARIASLARPLLIALDVDGTLAPIVDDPAAAQVPAATARTLERLDALPDVQVALVTGRDATQLAAMIDGARYWRVVEHGRRLLAPHEAPAEVTLTAAKRAGLDAFRARAERE